MKIIYKNIWAFLFILLGACGSLVEDLNTDPNSPSSAPYQNILTGAEVGNIILQSGESARRAGIFCGYYTGIDRQHQSFTTYTVTTSDFNSLWDDAFINTLRNAKITEETALESGVTGITQGITQVLQAMAYGTATSLYGDIPFDEASFEFENPAFEGQVEVYGKIQLLLDEAIANLESGSGRPVGGSEIYFDGDPSPWIHVAYSLKARYYMHTKEYADAYEAASLGISSMVNSMYAPHGEGITESNLNYQFFKLSARVNDLIVSDFMVSMLDANAATNPDITNYRGNAKTNEAARYNFYYQNSSVGVQPNTETDGWAAQTASAPLITYEENMLILAEAGFRSEGFATGLSHLNEFRSFMDAGGYMINADPTQTQYDAYVAADFQVGGIENLGGLSNDDALLREILEERYATLFGQIEGFSDTRRTRNELSVRVPVVPNTGTVMPERFIYPQSEIDRNSNIPNPRPDTFEPTAVNQ